MLKSFVVHYKLRKGLGPDWVCRTEEIAFDDLPEDIQYWEIKDMVRNEFKSIRYKKGTREKEYIITDICEV